MFDHHCSSCDKTLLIFPSQLVSLENTDHGIELRFTCWCGAEQTAVFGRRAGRRTAGSAAA